MEPVTNPDKWIVKRTPESFNEINDWFNDIKKKHNGKDRGDYLSNTDYMHYPYSETFKSPSGYIVSDYSQMQLKEEGYKELTIDEFRQFILRQEGVINNSYSLF